MFEDTKDYVVGHVRLLYGLHMTQLERQRDWHRKLDIDRIAT